MNKKRLRIAGALAAFAMMVGAGVAVGASAKAIETDAADYTAFGNDLTEGDYVIYYNGKAMKASISANNRFEYLEVTPVDGKISDPNSSIVWHIAPNGDYWTLYNAATEKYGGAAGKNTGALLDEVTNFAKWTVTRNNSTYDFENLGRSGAANPDNKWLRNNGTYGFAAYASSTGGKLSLYKLTEDPSGQPAISLSSTSLSLNAGNSLGMTVTVIPSGFGEGEKHFAWSTENTNITLENANTNVVTVKPNTNAAGSATVNVSVWGGEVDQGDALTASVSVSIDVPKTVAQALEMSGSSNVYTKGIISQIDEVNIAEGKQNATYWISDDGTTTNQLEIYRGKYLGNVGFTAENQIQLGDVVVVYGDITTYKEVVEYAQGNYLVSLVSEPRLTLDPAQVTVTLGMNAEVTATPSNFASGAVTYSFSTNACATLSYEGNTITVHGDAIGSHTFTVTGLAGGVNQTTAELVVNVVNPYPTSINRTGYANYADRTTFAEGTGSVTITYSDGSTAVKHLGDEGVKLLVSGVEVPASTSTATYIGSHSGTKISFTEEGHTVETAAYTLTVVAEVEVVGFTGVPEYLIIDSEDPNHSATVTVNYRSINGEPELSIVSSNPSKLIVAYDENDNTFEGTEGHAQFTITAGTAVGQYSVTASVTYNGRTESKSFSINVRGEAPVASEGDYQKISNLNDLVTGDYVIGAYVSSSYRGMTYSFSSSKYSNCALTVAQDKVSSTDGDSMKFHLAISGTGDERTATIYDPNAKKYVKYVSGTNLGQDDNAYNWTISAGTKGTFRVTSGDNTRALIFRTSTYNVFGGYATSNVTAQGDEYYDLELFKFVESVAPTSSFDLVNTFVTNYMHMNDVSIGNNGDTGACRGDSGYYLTAKRAWNAMATAYEGEDNLQEVFEASFEDAYARYLAWALAMNDAAPFDGQDSVVTPVNAVSSSGVMVASNNQSFIIMIAFIATLALATVGMVAIARKRR